MALTAIARTDERGHRLVGEFPANMKTVPLVQERKDPWEIKMKFLKKCRLGDLIGRGGWNMLVMHMINDKKFFASDICHYDRRGIIRAIRVGHVECRADSLRIFEKHYR